MALEICSALRGVYTFHLLTAVIWLGLEGNGASLLTNNQSFDGINATKATSTEQPMDLVTSPTEEPTNFTLGTP